MSSLSKSCLTKPSAKRSALMRRVRRKDTAPELAVRRYLFAAGLRYRLHVTSLAGTPDMVLKRHNAVVFVHGCFWHGHDCPHGRHPARSNREFWHSKIAANRERDRRKSRALRNDGWRVFVVWECQVEKTAALQRLCEKIRRPAR